MKIENVSDTLSVRNAQLAGSGFEGTGLASSRFQDVNLHGAAFTDVSLAAASFEDVNLHAAAFANVSLVAASFADVDLTNASITNANLAGTTIDSIPVSDLVRVYRSQAKLTPAAGRAGAVVYAKDLTRVQGFYHHVLGLGVERVESDHLVLGSASFELVIVRIPAHLAATIGSASAAHAGVETPVKLVFEVADLAAARATAHQHGGALYPAEREWDTGGCRVCDGLDPEGNVVQLRQRTSAAGRALPERPGR